jgi:hypothetical protein
MEILHELNNDFKVKVKTRSWREEGQGIGAF